MIIMKKVCLMTILALLVSACGHYGGLSLPGKTHKNAKKSQAQH